MKRRTPKREIDLAKALQEVFVLYEPSSLREARVQDWVEYYAGWRK